MSAEVGAFQLCRGKNRVCGDCYDSFTDPTGALYIVLSDGMGTGSRARIDSALACSMASRLIKGGISLPAALEMVNTSLMVKSSDESFATLDICRLDLNSGECVIYKAGAAASYIRSADRLLRASVSSAPAGTGGRVTVPAQKFRVAPGDHGGHGDRRRSPGRGLALQGAFPGRPPHAAGAGGIPGALRPFRRLRPRGRHKRHNRRRGEIRIGSDLAGREISDAFARVFSSSQMFPCQQGRSSLCPSLLL